MLDRTVTDALFLAARDGDLGAAERHIGGADPLLRPLLRRRLRAWLARGREVTAIPPTVEGEAHLLRLAALLAAGELRPDGAAGPGYRSDGGGGQVAPEDHEGVARRLDEVLARRRPARWRPWAPTAALVLALGGAGAAVVETHVRVPAAYRHAGTPLGRAFGEGLTEYIVEAGRRPGPSRVAVLDRRQDAMREASAALGPDAARALDELLALARDAGPAPIEPSRAAARDLARRFNEGARAARVPVQLGVGVDTDAGGQGQVLWASSFHVESTHDYGTSGRSTAGRVTVTRGARLDTVNVRTVQRGFWSDAMFGGSLMLLEDVEGWVQQRILPALVGRGAMSLGAEVEVAEGSELEAALVRAGEVVRDDLVRHAGASEDDARAMADLVQRREAALRPLAIRGKLEARASRRLLLPATTREALDRAMSPDARSARRLDDRLHDPAMIRAFERLRDACADLLEASEARRLLAGRREGVEAVPAELTALFEGGDPEWTSRTLRRLEGKLGAIAHAGGLARVALLPDLTPDRSETTMEAMTASWLLFSELAVELGLPWPRLWLDRPHGRGYPRVVNQKQFYAQVKQLLDQPPAALAQAAGRAHGRLLGRPVEPLAPSAR